MFEHFQFTLESRPRGARNWAASSTTTSHWPSVPALLEGQVKARPDQEWRIVGELVQCDETGKPITLR